MTLRLYDALGVHPALGGVYLAIAWTVLLIGGEWASGRLAPEAIDAPDGIELFELAVALFLGLFLVFVTAAYAAYSRRTALTVDALRACCVLTEAEGHPSEPGQYPRIHYWAWSAVGLAAGAAATYLDAEVTDTYDPYIVALWSPEVVMHRTLAPLIGLWQGRLVFAIVWDSLLLSRAARQIADLDLTDLSWTAPFTAQSLANVAIVAGFASFFAILLVDPRYVPVVGLVLAVAAVGAGLGLLLPLLGLRARIRRAKEEELAWVRPELRLARNRIKAGDPAGAGRVADLTAYEHFIHDVPDWGLDAGVLTRFGIYLLIPVLSWSGGALVERAIDAILD